MIKSIVNVTVWYNGIPFNTNIHCTSIKEANRVAQGMVHVLSHGNSRLDSALGVKGTSHITLKHNLREWEVCAYKVLNEEGK